MKVHGIYVQRKILGLNLVSPLYYVPKCKCGVYLLFFKQGKEGSYFC
jgi:hypothetical protein